MPGLLFKAKPPLLLFVIRGFLFLVYKSYCSG